MSTPRSGGLRSRGKGIKRPVSKRARTCATAEPSRLSSSLIRSYCRPQATMTGPTAQVLRRSLLTSAMRLLMMCLLITRAGPGQFGMTLKDLTVLSALHESGGMGQRELGEAMLLDANSTSIMLTGLEDRGLLIRTLDRADRRRYWVTITDAGETERQRAEIAMGEAGTAVLGSLSPAEISQLRELAAKALDAPGNQESGR